MHQYRVRIISKPEANLFKADLLPRQNHNENRNADISEIQLSMSTIQTVNKIPECMTMHELQQAMSQDQQLQHV